MFVCVAVGGCVGLFCCKRSIHRKGKSYLCPWPPLASETVGEAGEAGNRGLRGPKDPGPPDWATGTIAPSVHPPPQPGCCWLSQEVLRRISSGCPMEGGPRGGHLDTHRTTVCPGWEWGSPRSGCQFMTCGARAVGPLHATAFTFL